MDAYDNPNRTPSNQNGFNRVPKCSNIPSKMANDKTNHFSLILLTYSKKFQTNQKFQNQYSKNTMIIIITVIKEEEKSRKILSFVQDLD